MDKNFWKTKPLSNFTEEEWEAVCMRCGKCCLYKTEKYGKILFSNKMCDSFNFKTGGCSHYATRLGSSCAKVDMRLLTEEPELLPATCAYRLLLAGQDLPDYHPLVSGNPNSAHEARQTVLEIPNIYPLRETMDIMKEISSHFCDSQWFECNQEKVDAQFKKCSTAYIESYDIPAKP